jgi:hypothetical protein
MKGVFCVSRLSLGDAGALVRGIADLAIHCEPAAVCQEAGLCMRLGLRLCPEARKCRRSFRMHCRVLRMLFACLLTTHALSDRFRELLGRTILVATNFRRGFVGRCVSEFLDARPPLASVVCFYGAPKCLALCLSRGIDVTIPDMRGRDAAHFAGAGGGVDCIGALSVAGLRLSSRDLGGRLPADVAAEFGSIRGLQRFVTGGPRSTRLRRLVPRAGTGTAKPCLT